MDDLKEKAARQLERDIEILQNVIGSEKYQKMMDELHLDSQDIMQIRTLGVLEGRVEAMEDLLN